MRPIKSRPLIDQEIEELNGFLLSDDGLENAMDVSAFDGFICAVLSGPNVIMPSEWMRWVWDTTDGEQSPEFTSEKQAKRILGLLMRHANVIAFTLTHSRSTMSRFSKIERSKDAPFDRRRVVLRLRQGHRAQSFGLATALDAQPDWFEVIHLYGTKAAGTAEGIGRGPRRCRCETSGLRGPDRPSRAQHPCLLACPPCPREDTIHDPRRPSTRRSFLAATTQPLWLRQEIQALPWGTKIVALTCGIQNCLRPVVPPQASTASLLRGRELNPRYGSTVYLGIFMISRCTSSNHHLLSQ